MIDLRTELPRLLPRAVAWAEEQQAAILASGFALSEEELAIARGVGVARPENLRIKLVDALPLPQDRALAAAAHDAGLLGSDMAGLTLFYGIYICRRAHGNRNLLAHECRHVFQHEQYGSISAFLKEYLVQVVTVGYEDAALEEDARRAAAPYS